MSAEQFSYPEKVDVQNCDKEPIHLIGKAQAHGVIVAVNPQTFVVTQASENTAKFFGVSHEDFLGISLEKLIGRLPIERLETSISGNLDFTAEELEINDKNFVMLPHLSGDNLILDFEILGESWNPFYFQEHLTNIINGLDGIENISVLCDKAAKLMRSIFGYDRVMVYRFDEEWNGEVVAEEKNEDLESWLDLRYPASDIPAQSRKLFLEHKVRIISDVNYEPVPILPELSPVSQKPLDLSRSTLRGVSPIHIEYLQNMKVGASLTAAIIVNGNLWGLIACHHYSAKFINYSQRETCKFLVQVFSNCVSSIQTGIFNQKIKENSELRERLLEDLQLENSLIEGLTSISIPFTSLIESGGGAVILDENIKFFGNTPKETEVMDLCGFLNKKEDPLFYTKNLKTLYPKAINYKNVASGILSFKLGKADNNFIIWFRPEVAETVSWGGNPNNKVSYNEEKQRLSPRKSFEKWTEKLDGISDNWKEYEIETAKVFGENINQFLLAKQKEEIGRLNQKLQEANKDLELFSYGISHDLRGPLRGINGFAQILKEDFSNDLPAEAIETINTVLSTANKMEGIIDDILSFSKITGGDLQKKRFDTNKLLDELLSSFSITANFPETEVHIKKNLPETYGDRRMIWQLWSNVLENALKYSEQTKDPRVEIGAITQKNRDVFYIKDNGIGIAKNDQDKIFNVFSRASKSQFKGTGVGLAIVARISAKHSGKIWVESEPGEGSTFYFYF
ncbi:Bacteriophytochrome (light-regulated signal transduction histidine kinase) [Salegentibacter holothuriorum]|uniref:histidine kinase n=1 Tax=Salegentibacter holothuriorum TaxID=241145 RepID=A0A1T5AML9_9FLAO|nr:ATP-binding protein [Salegentibacter holothuriorum]SKB36125.1 Bacteriophytochrome (light-regulated signal transduction histidine kinase) [Salegentibacter holothuriorum]